MSFAFWQRYLWTLEAILGEMFGLAEIFGGFWPNFSEAIWGEILGSGSKLFKYIYNFDQIFKLFSQESIQEWIILTIYSKLFKTVDNFDQIFKFISQERIQEKIYSTIYSKLF